MEGLLGRVDGLDLGYDQSYDPGYDPGWQSLSLNDGVDLRARGRWLNGNNFLRCYPDKGACLPGRP